MKHKRNGDWSIHQIDQKEFNKLKAQGRLLEHSGKLTFAEGEATNHFHVAKVKDKKDMTFIKMPDGSYLVELTDTAILTHPEHSEKVDLEIEKGFYRFYQRREKDWVTLATRKVID